MKQLTGMAMDVIGAECQEQKLALTERKLRLAEQCFKFKAQRPKREAD